MGVKLYEHNEKAYRAARKMLDEKGLAAVVHPTGTGKSFITFKLCEDEPDKTDCWLGSSEYILNVSLKSGDSRRRGTAEHQVLHLRQAYE